MKIEINIFIVGDHIELETERGGCKVGEEFNNRTELLDRLRELLIEEKQNLLTNNKGVQ